MKKLVALLLALVLVVGLCACAKKAETTTPTDGSEQTSESAATAQSKGTIGITLPTQELARCLKDQEYLTSTYSLPRAMRRRRLPRWKT